MNKTLYERIGGEPAVSAAVEIFYRKVLNDYRINRFFGNTDMDKQIAKQKAFFTMDLAALITIQALICAKLMPI
jgi:hemoglobin